MAAGKAKVTVRGGFPAGAKVGLYDRVGDFAGNLGAAVKTATVSKDSEVEFEGLPEGGAYWAAAMVDGTPRVRAVTAKVQAERQRRQERPTGPEANQTRSGADQPHEVVTGARSTSNTRVRGHRQPSSAFSIDAVGKPTPAKAQDPYPAPAPRLEDAKGPQRSDTLTGEATPVDPNELQPKPSQSDIAKGTPQRSDTEFGEATPVDPSEIQPAARQEDAAKGLVQRSATEHGQVEPIPQDKPQAEKKKRDSSESKAKGDTPAKPQAKNAASTKSRSGESRPESNRRSRR